jgi:ABC-2 type transport system ATP-binding protein
VSIASITNLTVRYGAKTVISDMTVTVPKGCVGLLGPNGAGKSTLLRTLLGFLKPASGYATVLGIGTAANPLDIRRRIGFMPEQDCHIPGMNAVTFVAYAGELAGMPANRAMSRAHEVLEYCGLGEARYRDVETYSTGMKQRIKLAQAIVHGPKLLFLDEPTNGLDPAGRDDMLNLIREISHHKEVNIVVSSHLLPDVERTCDDVIVMSGGQVVEQGSVARLRQTEGAQIDIDLQMAHPPFTEALTARGGKVLNQLGARYRVAFNDSPTDFGRLILESARDSGAQIRGFCPALRSLEDIFMEAVK